MAVTIRCKMCGGDLLITEGKSVAECENCGTLQTVPSADSEKKLTLFARANRLRSACEFDKAAGVYEAIVAEFPEEAEAYWGLVLCKYGIEYVDDPATGKKIPTCHRSSFDSLKDDPNFELALENADTTARRVYRDEAKVIDDIREGIIKVSSLEKPYDIFICYKETDENGDRTVDSVIAQDIYDALTAKGYRVFFSRITLEDKLGQAYEPYIFAALNSAKIMLAVGTDCEYYNAVWVKNEWSRYLKLKAKDASRQLIPCYKGIDPYDMPREFSALQGQDMGKVGAMQDLLRGIEKILPKAAPVAVVQERVVVGGSGSNKIASLLDRGNMALEDGDWAKADSFFEDVLNNDSKNAQAYLGKTLAQERCRTIDAFIRKRKALHERAEKTTFHLMPKQQHIQQAAEQYELSGYANAKAIRALYDFDLSYISEVPDWKAQYQNEENYWVNHKQLGRAEKFAEGAVAENLLREKKAFFATLAQRVKQAEDAEAKAKAELQTRYDAHIAKADERAQAMYEAGLKRRQADYESLLQTAKHESDIPKLTAAMEALKLLGDYEDSKNLARHCGNRIIEEEGKRYAAEEAKRFAEKAAAAARRKKNTTIGIIAAIAAVIIIAAVMVVTKVIIPNNNYQKAETLLAEGKRVEAAQTFMALGDYEDAADRAMQAWDGVVTHNPIAAAQFHTVAVKNNGTVVAVGSDENAQCAVQSWTDIISVAAGTGHTVGLKADGTVVATGYNPDGRCDVSGWTQIVDIAAGYEFTLGLRADGTILVAGKLTESAVEVTQWTNIKDINAEAAMVCGKTTEDKYLITGQESPDSAVQTDIGSLHVVCLREDGTVYAYAHPNDGKCDVEDWTDIMAVAAGWRYTLGLKTDGTVVATTITTDDYDEGQCNVLSWTDIVGIYSGGAHTIGLKADGTVVATGTNDDGQCEVSGWTDIRLPEITEEQLVAMDAVKAEKEQALVDAYNAAVAMLDEGNYTGAMEAFSVLGIYSDSAEKLQEAKYQQALVLIGQESYTEAHDLLVELKDYADAADYLANYRYLPTYVRSENNTGNVQEFYFTYDASGKMIEGYRDAYGECSPVYTFDEKGAVRQATLSSGIVYTYVYSADGSVDEISDKSGYVFHFDAYGNVIGSTNDKGERTDYSALVYDEKHNQSSFSENTYDENGNLISVNYHVNALYKYSEIQYETFYLTDTDAELAWKNLRILCGSEIW